jgi:hypothetical protein
LERLSGHVDHPRLQKGEQVPMDVGGLLDPDHHERGLCVGYDGHGGYGGEMVFLT